MNKIVATERWVTESVLIERINERLTDDSHKQKESQMEGSPSLGHFYEQPDRANAGPGPIDIEAVGREMGVLAPDESVARDADEQSSEPVKNKLVLD